MSTTSSRLDAIAATLQTANARDFDLRYEELMDTMRVRQLSKDDFNKLVPEAIDAFQRDIVREAMLLSQEAHNGDEIRIFGYCGLAAAVVVIPPGTAVPSTILDQVDRLQSSAFPMPIEILDERATPYFWMKRVLYSLALGDDRGDALRTRFHHGEFAHISVDDKREIEPVIRDRDSGGDVEVAAALVGALTGRNPESATGPTGPARIADPMQYIV